MGETELKHVIALLLEDSKRLQALEPNSGTEALGKNFTAVDDEGKNVLPFEYNTFAPSVNPNVKFEGYERDAHGEDLATFSGVFVY